MYYYLLYFGIARNQFTAEDFNSLLAKARSRNESLDITGKLLHCEGTFIQLLEGKKENVEEVYHSITKDDRLIALKIITVGAASERYYKDWSMAFKDVTMAEINEIENCSHHDVAAYIKSASAIRLLKLLVIA
ncbi:BLUF domain-containing protein [Pedobacter frigiditerrae]|uniref:BLUF domain-containing protein n=1 Tax=Pedobacter frigiditerrae TaxID=2530452 RepID=A0A4R0MTJ7_9SPHI|nr:BLUF domain-containing protein [Pedobacter frigiditerrae]TCC90401.1 BLUF domain-containing protein [Pedobacter frigiditerrae]